MWSRVTISPPPRSRKRPIAGAFVGVQAFAGVHGEQPHLVEVRGVERAQHGVGLALGRGAVAGGHLHARHARQVVAQQREAGDRPVVLSGLDGGLQQDANGLGHGEGSLDAEHLGAAPPAAISRARPRAPILGESPCPSAACRPRPSTASPPARWSSARPARSRSWSRTRSTPAPRRIEVQADGGGLTRILVADDGAGLTPRRAAAGGRAPRHLQAQARRRRRLGPAAHRHPRLPRRGPAVDRLGGAADASPAGPGAADAHAILVEGGAGRRGRARAPSPAPHGARVEVRDLFYATPGAAEVHEVRAHRGPGHHRGGQAPGHGARGGGLHPRPRRPPHPAPAGRASRRRRAGCARLARGDGPRVRGQRPADRPRARGRAAVGLCRPADLQPRQRRPPVPVRQRPAGARPAAAGRPARPPTPTSWPATAIRWRPCSSSSTRARSTSTSTRPRPRCASAIRPWCAA